MYSIFGKIIGEKNPVFVSFNSAGDIASAWPLVATFDHGNHNSYMLLETGRACITGFRFNYADDGIHLDAHLSDEELKIVRIALGIIVTSLMCQEGISAFEGVSPVKLSELKYFTSVVSEVMRCSSKDIDIIDEISLKSGLNVDEVICILLELSNMVGTNFNGGN